MAMEATRDFRLAASTNIHVPAAATAAIVTYAAAGAGVAHLIEGVAWSYSAAPTGGRLTITDAGVTVFDIDITAAGPGYIPFPRGLRSDAANTAMVVTLASGAGAVAGKVAVIGYRTVPV